MKSTKLIIQDECNVKFEGLDIVTRRKLVESLEFFLPHARHTPAYKLGRWNGKISFCDIGARSYLNLLDTLLPIVQGEGYDIEIEDNRAHHNFEFTEVVEDSYAHITWPKGHPLAGQPIMIREHQLDVINSYLTNITGINIAPTGAGKTIITAVLSHKVEPYGRSIVIVPTKDLVTQTEEDYINMGLDVGVFFGDRKEYSKTHTICTWQSLESLSKRSKETDLEIDIEDFFEGVVCVIVDECFHPDELVLTSSGYSKISDIKVGDKIINYSEKDNIYKEDTVEAVHKNLTKSSKEKMYELEMDNGVKIKVTGNHRFLTQRGWVRADQLTHDDDIKNLR
jgi:hypothetical protein